MDVSLSRRERLRESTLIEIKEVARKLLVAGGAPAVTLRAISREMGMTPSALYSYYSGLDALIGDLREALFVELSEVTTAARADAEEDDPVVRLNRVALAFRRWALDNRAEFGLMFGPAVLAVCEKRDRGETDFAMARFCTAFLGEIMELWEQGRLKSPPQETVEHQLAPHVGAFVAERADELPLPVVFVFLTAWTRIYGIVAMEVFGHVDWAVVNAESLFAMELANCASQVVDSEPTPRKQR